MVHLTRRRFGGLVAGSMLAGALSARPAFSQAANLSFMSFSFAEDPNRPLVQKVLDDFKAQSGVGVEAIGSAWGDMQKNLLLRQRSKTLPTTAQLSERWLPALGLLGASSYLCGNYIGAGLVLKRGQSLVRTIVLLATSALLLRHTLRLF